MGRAVPQVLKEITKRLMRAWKSAGMHGLKTREFVDSDGGYTYVTRLVYTIHIEVLTVA
jgi:hypothetical protein